MVFRMAPPAPPGTPIRARFRNLMGTSSGSPKSIAFNPVFELRRAHDKKQRNVVFPVEKNRGEH